jgi:glucan 1,3-beta-glucosidase
MRLFVIVLVTGLLANVGVNAHAAPLPPLHPDGTRMVDPSGKPVILKGCNLGNWLLIEPWMLRWDIADQQSLMTTFSDRFGTDESQKLMESFRDGYIRARDFDVIKTFGFNLVRVPFDSRLLMDDAGTMRPEPFHWLDRAVDMAEEAGVYVILDMHGAPGGQSMDQCTGERNRNKLWTSAECQDQMARLWTAIAGHFKDRDTVIAYELANEPYGAPDGDVRPQIKALMPRIYQAIRSADDSKLVIFPNNRHGGMQFFGDLKATGLKNIGFTDHYYPGLFNSPPELESYAKVFQHRIPDAAQYLESQQAPMLLGEFNAVHDNLGAKAIMRRYYDESARLGWMCTMWSYKLLKPTAGVQKNNWYMVTNAQALPAIDPKTSTLDEIRGYIQNLSTMKLAIDDSLRDALTAAESPPCPLPGDEPASATRPAAAAE